MGNWLVGTEIIELKADRIRLVVKVSSNSKNALLPLSLLTFDHTALQLRLCCVTALTEACVPLKMLSSIDCVPTWFTKPGTLAF